MKRIVFVVIGLTLIFSTSITAQKKAKKKQKNIQTVVNAAYSYKGVPYRYGGTTKSGIDCSALMQNSFFKAGYKIPRTAQKQLKYGKKIGWASIKQGDLVFFKFKKKRKKWFHSGLITVVEKNKIYFIHASTSKGVIVSNLNSDYYKKNVKAFRRVIR